MALPRRRFRQGKPSSVTPLCPHFLLPWILVVGWLSFRSNFSDGKPTQALEGFKSGAQARYASRQAEPYYNFSSVPPKVLTHVQRWVESGECMDNGKSVIVSCCYRHWRHEYQGCGGIADRMKGLSTALLGAERAGRKLCIDPDYMVSAPLRKCLGGVYERITEKADISEDNDVNPLKDASYVSSNKVMDRPNMNLIGKMDAGRIGALMVAVSGTLDFRMTRAIHALEAARDIVSSDNDYVAVHVRCGASNFRDAAGNTMNCIDYFDKKNTTEPDGILQAARDLPQNLECKKMLYVSSDSKRYRAELESALPEGMKKFACCTSPEHIDKVAVRSENLQHLVDLAAFASSNFIFRTSGGYAVLGSALNSWKAVESEAFSGDSIHSSPKLFWKAIVEKMECVSQE